MPLFEANSVTTTYSNFQGYMHILGPENATFWGRSVTKGYSNFYGYYMYWTYKVKKMPLFRQLLLLRINPALMVTTYIAHIRFRKCHFWGDSWYYSFLQLSRLLYVLNILGQENATFWGNFCYYNSLQCSRFHADTRSKNATFWGRSCYYSLL